MKVIIAFKKEVNDDSSLFTKISSKAISWWTKHPYYHCELIIKDKWISSHPDLGGVRVLTLDKLRPTWDYYEINLPDITKEQEEILWGFLQEQINTGYDWKGIFLSQFVKIGLNSDQKWFCSEIVVKLLQLMYCKTLLDIVPNKISPADLFKILEKELLKVKL